MVGLVLVVALILAAPTVVAGAAENRPPAPEPMRILESSFRQGRTDRLRELMTAQEKVYLNSPRLGLDNGYYSADQVCLLLQEIFRSRTTVRFDFLSGMHSPPGAPRVVAVSRWTYRRSKSREQTIEIAFTLIRRDGGWSLKEIRDIP